MATELDRRKMAVQAYYYQRGSKADICRQMKRSRSWLDRWLKRYDPDDVEGSLRDHKPGPKQASRPWSTEIRQQVIEMRHICSQQPYALIGAEAIHYELKALNSPEVPPVRTIHDWLVKAGLVEPEPGQPAKRESKPIPLPPASAVNDVQQLDLKGPVYLRGSGHKYYLVVLRDCYSRRCAIDVLTSREALGIVNFSVASWQWMGLPTYLQMDNALELRGSNRHPLVTIVVTSTLAGETITVHFLIGAGLVLVGVFVGVLLPSNTKPAAIEECKSRSGQALPRCV